MACRILLRLTEDFILRASVVLGRSSNNNNNDDDNTAQNKLPSVVLMALQTNMSLVFRQKSAEKQTQGEGSLANCSTQLHHLL